MVGGLATVKAQLVAGGIPADQASGGALAAVAAALARQGSVIGFDRTCLLQAATFLLIMPLLYFLRVPRGSAVPAAAHMAAE